MNRTRRRKIVFVALLCVLPCVLLLLTYRAASWRPKLLLKAPNYWLEAVSPQGNWMCLLASETKGHHVLMWNIHTRHAQKIQLPIGSEVVPLTEEHFICLKSKATIYQATKDGSKGGRTQNNRSNIRWKSKFEIEIKHYEDGAVVRHFQTPSSFIRDSIQDWSLSPDKRTLFVLSSKAILSFDVATGKMLSRRPWSESTSRLEDGPWSEIYKISPDARWIVAITPQGHLALYSARNGKRLPIGVAFEVGEDIRAVSFTANPNIVQCNEAGETSYRHLPDGKKLWRWEPDTILSTPDGECAAAITSRGLEFRDLSTGRFVSKRTALTDKETALVFSQDGFWAYTTDGEGTLKRWRLK